MAIILAPNPARDLLNTIIRHARSKTSRENMIKCATEYGAYCKVMECDINLIREAIKETKRKDLAAALSELYSWYWKMDVIAAKS